MSDRKSDVGNVFRTMGKLFFGTDKEHADTAAKLATDAAATVKRARARDGAINAIGEGEGDDEEAPTRPSHPPPRASRGR